MIVARTGNAAPIRGCGDDATQHGACRRFSRADAFAIRYMISTGAAATSPTA
jgi:hypothetical protein